MFGLLAGNLLPVITHPERLLKWIETDCYVQVTVASFQGRFGKQAQRSAELLLEHRLIHFIASEAHNTSSRPPVLSEVFRAIAAGQGEEVARYRKPLLTLVAGTGPASPPVVFLPPLRKRRMRLN